MRYYGGKNPRKYDKDRKMELKIRKSEERNKVKIRNIKFHL